MGLEGDLREFSLINVMQIICMERRKAGLYVTRRGEEAVIYFDDGDVVYADAGHLKGEEAIYQLLTWTDGTFRTAEHNGQPGKNIVKNWNHLLIEGMRRLDEQRRDEPDVEDRTLSTTEAQHDRNLGDGLMVLLSNMEQGMAKLGDKKVQKRPESAKTVLSDLVNSAVEFGEQIPAARNTKLSLHGALRQASAVFPKLSRVGAVGNRLPAESNSSGGSSWKGIFAERNPDLNEICHGLILVLESYFSAFAGFFLSPSMREQWQETYSVFVVDLKRNVNAIQF